MKKKIFGGIALLAITAVMAFNVNVMLGAIRSSYQLDISLSNIEATASEATFKVYKDATGDCPPPKEYKKWRSCPQGTDLSTCTASDC